MPLADDTQYSAAANLLAFERFAGRPRPHLSDLLGVT